MAWARRPGSWLLAGAGSGTASVAILMAVSSWTTPTPDWLVPVTPGLVFGVVLGGLLHLSRPRPAWRIGCYVVASTMAHHSAYEVAVRFGKMSVTWSVWSAGILAGTLGSAMLATASLLVFTPRAWPLLAAGIVGCGGLCGAFLAPAMDGIHAQPWGLLILYVPWQAAVAFASACFFISDARPAPGAGGGGCARPEGKTGRGPCGVRDGRPQEVA